MVKARILLGMLTFLMFNACSVQKQRVDPPPKPVVVVRQEEKKAEPDVPLPDLPEETEPKTDPMFMEAPYVQREFRAAWVATVANIDWPSRRDLSVGQQKEEAIEILDFLEEHNFNAVIFQARPQADAFYDSKIEPWSYFLTGRQGEAPVPYYDPLEFWLAEAHKRGLEFHVWLNPYRAHHTTGGDVTETSIVSTSPEVIVPLKNGMYWMDPSLQSTQDMVAEVVSDIVRRYDIDGLHFDDYFYPYESYNGGKPFPDDASWSSYQQGGGALARNDWRRENVNRFIKRIYGEIKDIKPRVKFGISPFGIWRPGHPASIRGMDAYDVLFADAKLWLNEGWVDYVAPQLYWEIGQLPQSFPVLLGWWSDQNTKGRHVWPGINIGLAADGNSAEIINQLMITRGLLESRGALHWSISQLMNNPEMASALVEGPYRKKALVPTSPWLDDEPPAAPVVEVTRNGDRFEVQWDHLNEEDVFHWVFYFRSSDSSWNYKILTGNMRSFVLHNASNFRYLGVTAVDRSGNQSHFEQIDTLMPLKT